MQNYTYPIRPVSSASGFGVLFYKVIDDTEVVRMFLEPDTAEDIAIRLLVAAADARKGLQNV